MTTAKQPLQIRIPGLDELDLAADKLLTLIGDRRVLAFSGEIGAGKTTFIQALCRRLGVTEAVTSPTFSLVNEYVLPAEAGEQDVIYHLDLYRLRQQQEALDIGIEEYLYSSNWCLIEWPELIEELLPEDSVRINLRIVDDSTRKMLIL